MRAKKDAATTATPKDIDEYLAGVPEDARATLQKLRKMIRSAAPKAVEVISYQMPSFKYHGLLVSFAAFKDHCSFFPGAFPIEEHKDELKTYHTSKGTVRFPIGKPLPAALVKKLVKSRVEQNEARAIRKGLSPMGSTDKVNEFMDRLDHPFKAEVQAVRKIIMNVHKHITEEIKWAAPTFSYKGYIASFNLWEKKYAHLVFHNGAILDDKSGLLEGDYVDRRLAKFFNMKDVKSKKAALEKAVKEWIRLMDQKS